jgi:hypothetical protein
MLARCNNPSHQAFRNYGGRGIRVCDRWSSFETFWADMRDDYGPGLTLDRTDNSAGYSRDNCRWVTQKIQCRNKRNNTIIATPIGPVTVAEASERFGIGRSTIHYRISKGWPSEKLLIEPDFTNKISQ